MCTPLVPLISNLRHLDGKGLWHILQEAESGRFVCSVTHRLQRWLSDEAGAKTCGRWVGCGQRFVHILSRRTPSGPHPRPPQPRPLLAESVKIQKPITAPTPPPLQGAGGVRLHSALTEHQVRVCVHKKHIQRHFTLLQRSEGKKHLHNISGAENFSAFINYTAATNVWRAETSRGPRRCGVERHEEGRGRQKLWCHRCIPTCLVLNTTNCFELMHWFQTCKAKRCKC